MLKSNIEIFFSLVNLSIQGVIKTSRPVKGLILLTAPTNLGPVKSRVEQKGCRFRMKDTMADNITGLLEMYLFNKPYLLCKSFRYVIIELYTVS